MKLRHFMQCTVIFQNFHIMKLDEIILFYAVRNKVVMISLVRIGTIVSALTPLISVYTLFNTLLPMKVPS